MEGHCMIRPFDPDRPKPLFKDRKEASEQLAQALASYRDSRPLVLGIPRGGVVMAEILARELDGDLDLVLVRKLRAPGRPEFAIGSITEQGKILLNDGMEGYATEDYLHEESREALDLMRRRRAIYTPGMPPADPSGRVTIVVDDGVATGATMVSALRSLRGSGATRVIAATAVAPKETAEMLRREADEIHCLATPEPFHAVSLHFEDFSEVSDEQVMDLLRRHSHQPAGTPPSTDLDRGNFGLERPRGQT
jgi:putative phosphoribosyl transferase